MATSVPGGNRGGQAGQAKLGPLQSWQLGRGGIGGRQEAQQEQAIMVNAGNKETKPDIGYGDVPRDKPEVIPWPYKV